MARLLIIGTELARPPAATVPVARHSVPVRLIRRVVAALRGHPSRTSRRALPARLVMVRPHAVGPPIERAQLRLPVRMLPRRRPEAVLAAPAGSHSDPRLLRVSPAARAGALPHRRAAFWYRVAITSLLAGAVVTVVGPGTFATFTSANRSSAAITTGTFVLGDTVSAGTECLSFSGAGANTIDTVNQNQGCDWAWSVSGTAAEPGKAIVPPQIAVGLKGSLTPATFQVSARQTLVPATLPACVSSTTPGETYNGGSNLCNVLQMYIQQYTANNYTTPLKCLYGAGSGTATCTGFDSTHTLSDWGNCHKLTGNAGGCSTLPVGPATIAVPVGPTPTSYFKIFVNFPIDSGNGYQGQQAGVGFTWSISQ